jgi:hypothetical protein
LTIRTKGFSDTVPEIEDQSGPPHIMPNNRRSNVFLSFSSNPSQHLEACTRNSVPQNSHEVPGQFPSVMRIKTPIACILYRFTRATHGVFKRRKFPIETRQEKRKGGQSGFLIILPKVSHPTKMATSRRAWVTHQLTRRGCHRRRVKQIIGCHNIGSVIALSIFATRSRRRTVKTRWQLQRGPRRRRLWC